MAEQRKAGRVVDAVDTKAMATKKEEVIIVSEEEGSKVSVLGNVKSRHSDLMELIANAHMICLGLPNSDHLGLMLQGLNTAAVELQRYIEELEEVERLTL